MRLRPFFSYYGSKFRLATEYPRPRYDLIVEPFAGSAAYALCYPDRSVVLCERDAELAALWAYLIRVREREILALPDVVQSVYELRVPESRTLVGFWLGRGRARPLREPSSWMRAHGTARPAGFWGPHAKERIARQLRHIRHWRILFADYTQAQRVAPATYFVDPPYQGKAGRRYGEGSTQIDYAGLAQWSRGLRGQVIVCEHASAQWLPFRPLVRAHGMRGTRTEGIWLSDGTPPAQLSLFERAPAAQERSCA